MGMAGCMGSARRRLIKWEGSMSISQFGRAARSMSLFAVAALLHRRHGALLALSLVTVAGAVASSQGWSF